MIREDYTFRGKPFSRFIHISGEIWYTYSHETGNMSMTRPNQWRPLAVMDRMPSRGKGVREGVPNDPAHAQAVAESHLVNYRQRTAP